MHPRPDQARDLVTLIQASQHQPAEFQFFCGHQPAADGSMTGSCFSQWFELGFELDGCYYPTAEHYMMAEKARLFGDESRCALILKAASPKQAKGLGRAVQGFDEALWAAHRFNIVVRANLAKFTQNLRAGDFLRQTGRKVIVEASPLDHIWGIGLGREHQSAGNPAAWRGLNLLGFALMEVRSQLA